MRRLVTRTRGRGSVGGGGDLCCCPEGEMRSCAKPGGVMRVAVTGGAGGHCMEGKVVILADDAGRNFTVVEFFM